MYNTKKYYFPFKCFLTCTTDDYNILYYNKIYLLYYNLKTITCLTIFRKCNNNIILKNYFFYFGTNSSLLNRCFSTGYENYKTFLNFS